MRKKLQEERDSGESNERKTVVTHFEMNHLASHISILVEGVSVGNDETTLYYDLIRYFKIGDDWVTSCDIRSGSAHDVFRKIGELV